MRIIEIEKIDQLDLLADELENIVFLEEMVKHSIEISQTDSQKRKACRVDRYLCELNADIVNRLCRLIRGESFTKSVKKVRATQKY